MDNIRPDALGKTHQPAVRGWIPGISDELPRRSDRQLRVLASDRDDLVARVAEQVCLSISHCILATCLSVSSM
jgi:hypothetical protein